MTATTALTAQNTTGVSDIHHVPPAFVRKQIDAVLDDMGADVVKTGMLASAETVAAVCDALEARHDGGPLAVVVDPVVVATTGAELLPRAALAGVRARLLPRATVLTPNVPEARLLLAEAGRGDMRVEGVGDLEAVGRALVGLGPEWVLVKGGHLPLRRDLAAARGEGEREVVVDVLVGRDGSALRIETPWSPSRSTHGTGCSLACGCFLFPLYLSGFGGADNNAAAIAANLAKGASVPDAVRSACRYVEGGIRTAPGFGKGSGPLNHFHSTYTLSFSP